jgi:cysteine desulfurase
MKPANLDFLSTTPMKTEVREAMLPWLGEGQANPGSLHGQGWGAMEAIGKAREAVAALIRAKPEQILFTSSGTEAANLAVQGYFSKHGLGGCLVKSKGEHPAVTGSARMLESRGLAICRVGLDGEGFWRIPELDGQSSGLLATHLSHQDSGAVQDVKALSVWARERGLQVFCDASIGGGWIEIDVDQMEVDFLSLSPHRFYGPQGVGVLYARNPADLQPLLFGGRQEFGLRAGTQNVAGIAGAGEAARLAKAGLADRAAEAGKKQGLLLEKLRTRLDGMHLHGPEPGPRRDPHHLNVSFDKVDGEPFMLWLDLQGIQVGSVTGCLSPQEKVSTTLMAMGVPMNQARGALLLGIDPCLPEAELDDVADVFARGVKRMREI